MNINIWTWNNNNFPTYFKPKTDLNNYQLKTGTKHTVQN